MERVACNPTEECKYYPRCYEDVHHIYGRALAQTAIQQVFGELDQSKRLNCRAFHEQDERENGWQPYPDEGTMIQAISSAIESGELHISKRQAKKIKKAIQNGGEIGDEISS